MPHLPIDTETLQPTYSLKRALFAVTAVIAIIFVYAQSIVKMPNYSAAGWHHRSETIPSDTFRPTRSTLGFALLLNAPVTPDGFTTAFFHPNIAVDARGKVLQVPTADWDALYTLAQETLGLPRVGAFNQWRIAHSRTSYPIDRLFVAPKSSGPLDETQVYGWDKDTDVLDPPVGPLLRLPPVLQSLIGLLHEASEGYVKGEEDAEVIARVKKVVDQS